MYSIITAGPRYVVRFAVSVATNLASHYPCRAHATTATHQTWRAATRPVRSSVIEWNEAAPKLNLLVYFVAVCFFLPLFLLPCLSLSHVERTAGIGRALPLFTSRRVSRLPFVPTQICRPPPASRSSEPAMLHYSQHLFVLASCSAEPLFIWPT